LLIATPALEDPDFADTVVLLVHHSDEGTFGIFLNRPTWVNGSEHFAVLADADASAGEIFFGGPVAVAQLLALVGRSGNTGGATEVLDGVYLTADITAIADAGFADSTDLRIFAGHAVWGPDQLQAEIDDRLWRIVDGSAELVFDTDADELLQRVSALADSGLTAATVRTR
jgi:putative transcriptional regulator